MYLERGVLYGTSERADAGKAARIARREERVWKRASGFVATTAGIRDAFAERHGPRRGVRVVPNGCDVPPWRAFPGLAHEDPPRVLYAGQLYPWKGVDVLVEAMAAVPGARLVILGGIEGEADTRRIRSLVEARGLGARTAMPGPVPQARVADALGRAAVVVAPFVRTRRQVTPKSRGAADIEYCSNLRSLVFDRDLEFGNEYERFYAADPQGLAGFKATFLERLETDTGRHINFAPLGSALLWSPFYLLAHAGVLAARALGAHVAADGFSFPYVAAVCYASALYGLAGLLLVHDALRGPGGLPEPAATLAVAGLWLATPLLYYMTLAPAFSHAAGVFAVALLLWLTLRAAARPPASVWAWAAIGAAGGLAALVREQDGLFLIVPAGLLLHHAISGRE